MNDFLDRYFGLKQHGTDVRTEVIAGVTTFLTMVYIVFVNPAILANAGMDKGAVFVATCVAAAISTLIMALYANYPIALAPGMGLNAFFAFTLVLSYKYTWQQALAFVLISGLLALIISLTPLREYVINAIPRNLKLAVSAGIGLFLFIIALEQAKIVVDHPATLVTLGDLKQWPAILGLAGFALIAALNARNVLGATLIGILVVTLIGIPIGLVKFSGVVSLPPSLAPTLLQLDFSRVLEMTALVVIFTLLLVDFFDTAGTLIGVAHRAKLLDKDGKLPRMRQALVADFVSDSGRLAAGYLEHHELYRERVRRTRWRPHRVDRGRGRGAVPARSVLLAARRHDPGLCVRRRAALRRGGDGAGLG